MPYKVGQFIVNKHSPNIYALITEATKIDDNFTEEYFYRYVLLSIYSDRVSEPNEVLDQCFYSFQENAANYSLCTEVPEKIRKTALVYVSMKQDKWSSIYKGLTN